MNLSTLSTSAAAALLLAGCASTYFPTRGGTDQDFAVAKYSCMQQSQPGGAFGVQGSQRFVAAAAGVMAVAAIAHQRQFFSACMAANGWVTR